MNKRVRRWARRQLIRVGYHTRPDFLIIGAQKAGTTALFSMLRQHPRIVAPRMKELHYFNDSLIPYADPVAYHAQFPLPHRVPKGSRVFEASPCYLYDEACPARIHAYDPTLKLIVVLREPVARAFSAWSMYHSFLRTDHAFQRTLADPRSFDVAVAEELGRLDQTRWSTDTYAYLSRGLYAEQLERYLGYFPRQALVVLEHQALRADPQAQLARVCRALQLDDAFAFDVPQAHVTRYTSAIASDLEAELKAFYAPHNQRLFDLLGTTYDW